MPNPDGLPGVVVDVLGDWLVMQALTAGAEYWKHTLADVLLELLPAKGVYERSDVDVRKRRAGKCHWYFKRTRAARVYRYCWEGESLPCGWYSNGHKTGFYLRTGAIISCCNLLRG